MLPSSYIGGGGTGGRMLPSLYSSGGGTGGTGGMCVLHEKVS